jgi:phospholipid/cholesterol/gamma-HCH transport system permease protein
LASATLAIQHQDDALTLTFAGHFDATTIASVWSEAQQALQQSTLKSITVDMQAVDYCDGAGIAMIFDIQVRAADTPYQLVGLKPEFSQLLEQFDPSHYQQQKTKPPHISLPEEVGQATYSLWQDIQRQIAFIGQLSYALYQTCRHPRQIRWQDMLAIAERSGVNAIPIVSLIAFILGVILAFQSADMMQQYGAEIFVADLLGISLFRELGPLLTAILLAGRSGAAFAAEIGTMKVNEEINALTTMGLDPIQFLVVPRVIAAVLTVPILTIFANIIGVVGGGLVMMSFHVPFATFINEMIDFLDLSDFLVGVFKAGVFGFIIATTGCMRGLETQNGASAVGQSTTNAVVTAIVIIVVLDGLFAVLFTQMGI